jgi:hypothetical protein
VYFNYRTLEFRVIQPFAENIQKVIVLSFHPVGSKN